MLHSPQDGIGTFRRPSHHPRDGRAVDHGFFVELDSGDHAIDHRFRPLVLWDDPNESGVGGLGDEVKEGLQVCDDVDLVGLQ